MTTQSSEAAHLGTLQARLLARAQQPVPRDWLPVVMAGREVGIASPEVAGYLATRTPHFELIDYRLVLLDDGLDASGRSALLADCAARLRDGGLLRGWRDELLDLRPAPDEAPIGVVERAACRTLGVTTLAVHLNAFTIGGELVVARRAEHKEEADLDLDRVALVRGGRVHVTRRVPEGFQSEIVQVFDAVLADEAGLRNRDGEVAAIERRPVAAVLAAIERDQFTLEAALVTLDALLRRTASG